jgi:hypothetical protein
MNEEKEKLFKLINGLDNRHFSGNADKIAYITLKYQIKPSLFYKNNLILKSTLVKARSMRKKGRSYGFVGKPPLLNLFRTNNLIDWIKKEASNGHYPSMAEITEQVKIFFENKLYI